jgi:hypothetical protein
MQVKVFFNKTTGVVSTNRMDTYKTLLEKTLKEFNLEEKIENCRIRSYHVFHHIMQDAYTGKDEHVKQNHYCLSNLNPDFGRFENLSL